MTTEDAENPVVLEGVGEIVRDASSIRRVITLVNAKYSTDYSADFLDPTTQATIRVRPRWAFGLAGEDFSGSPTRWVFTEEADPPEGRESIPLA